MFLVQQLIIREFDISMEVSSEFKLPFSDILQEVVMYA